MLPLKNLIYSFYDVVCNFAVQTCGPLLLSWGKNGLKTCNIYDLDGAVIIIIQ